MILNLGAGVNRKRLYQEPFPEGTVHIDHNPDVKPDIVWDLERGLPPQIEPCSVDEIHAYHLIEHIGRMGETEVWFGFWSSCWRALKPGGQMFVDAPFYLHEDAIGDPTHTRLICRQTFHFLDRSTYLKKDGDDGCAQSKFSIDFDFRLTDLKWLKSHMEDAIPCGLRVVLQAEKTAEGGLVALGKELQGVAR